MQKNFFFGVLIPGHIEIRLCLNLLEKWNDGRMGRWNEGKMGKARFGSPYHINFSYAHTQILAENTIGSF